MQTNVKPSARLCSAIEYLTPNGRIADIGTDHAYLPIYLIREGYSSHALAADINEGPIRSAIANIAAARLSDRIDTLRTDGLHGVESYAPDDILIFGMGGELIARILEDAPWVKNGNITLILQPMSRGATLCEFLLREGFSIIGETVTYEDKYYRTIAACYTGLCEEWSAEELLIGKRNIEARAPLFEGYVRHEIAVLRRIVEGKQQSANADTSAERSLIEGLERLL